MSDCDFPAFKHAVASWWTGSIMFPWLHALLSDLLPYYFILPGLLSSDPAGIRSDPSTCQDYFRLGASEVTHITLCMESISPIFLPLTPSPHSDLSSCFTSSRSSPWFRFLICVLPSCHSLVHQLITFKIYLLAFITIWNQPINQLANLPFFFVLLICLPPLHPNWMEEEASSVLIIGIFSVPEIVLGTQRVFNNYLVNIELKTSKGKDIGILKPLN